MRAPAGSRRVGSSGSGRSSHSPPGSPRPPGSACWTAPRATPSGLINAFAAGAVLTMLTDVMFPEALKHGGRTTGLATVLGFAVAFLLTTLG